MTNSAPILSTSRSSDDASGGPAGLATVDAIALRDGVPTPRSECVADEVAIAIEVNGISHAVMLATPLDLEDFALGFLLSEGLIKEPGDLLDVEPEVTPQGVTLGLTVTQRCLWGFKERRRTLTGRTGCGLCGTESIDQAMRPVAHVDAGALRVPAAALSRAMRELAEGQELQRACGAVHAAAWATAEGQVKLVREDVGRHNALDKLIGALVHAGVDAHQGFIVVTSRASYEMVQKTASAGVGLLAAISAPTRLAIQTAQTAGVTLAGFVRGTNAVLYAHAERVVS
ncbi:MAG TPA: formate dehydrogenase accessory sulfurtransferase FdhD [Burkholderiaceae bacterium]|nr:formate dehydrogenase accessory sulfurtransferase FdhD [Burkholderiaceae bacterium]